MAQALAADVLPGRCGPVPQQRAGGACVLHRPVAARPCCGSALAGLSQCHHRKRVHPIRVAPALRGHSVKRSFTCSVSCQQRQDPVQQARTTQEQTTKLLAELLQAPDTAATARAHLNAIDEEFFMVSSTYLDMARQEGNKEVCTKLEQVLKVAMEEKQKTLRPEIQLLNNLMAATTVPERERVLDEEEAKAALVMNNGYFFGLLDRMISDVGRQPDNPRKKDVMDQLQQINKRTHAQRKSVNR